MSKNKLGTASFTSPHKYVLQSTKGKAKKSHAHRYERRRIRECLRHSDGLVEDLSFA